jgi:16S rRNA (cytidine1402-2'-O)-methyltransferase
MEPGLYIVGTPIGNLGDITLRALETLKAVNLIVAEDTRHTRKLLDHFEIRTPMASCHRFNEASRVDLILSRIRAGEAVALVTDSGMPSVSDPGARVVAACRQAGVRATVVPGPSSVTAAVALSGMESGGFVFEGFLPHKSGQRRRRIAALMASEHPLVFFESPYRLLKLMDEIEQTLGNRRVFVARELTKHFEECLSGTPAEIREAFRSRAVKGELVVIVQPEGKRAKERGPAE